MTLNKSCNNSICRLFTWLALTCAQVTQLCLILDAQLEDENYSAEVLECYFLEALYSSLGATLLESDRTKFDEFIKRLSGLTTVLDEKDQAAPGEIPGKITSVNKNVCVLFCLSL